jgi:hypothetical protein
LSIPTCGAQHVETGRGGTAGQRARAQKEERLPCEPGSAAELLAATYVFLVEIVSLEATPWALGEDRLEHRRVRLDARVLEVWKGHLDGERGATFPWEVEQEREGEMVVSDYHGMWSHEELVPGCAT